MGFSNDIPHPVRFRAVDYSKFFGDKSVLFIECTRVHIDLQSVQPDMIGRKLAGVIQQSFSNPAILIIGMNI